MTPQDAEPAARPLPPRPNPGPESYPPEERPSALWALLVLPVAALAAWRLRRVRSIPARVGDAEELTGDADPLSPAERLARLADRIRDGLARRFGIPGPSLTTEEFDRALKRADGAADGHIAGEDRGPGQPEAIPPFPRDIAIRFLRAADRAKFSADPIDESYLAEAEALAAPVLEALDAGATSSQIGR